MNKLKQWWHRVFHKHDITHSIIYLIEGSTMRNAFKDASYIAYGFNSPRLRESRILENSMTWLIRRELNELL